MTEQLPSDQKLGRAQREAVYEHPGFAAFCDRFGEAVVLDFMERLADLSWSGDRVSADGSIRITDCYQHNAANHTYSGTLSHAGEEFGFIIEQGDRNGTLVRDFGPADDVGTFDPPEPELYTFVPADDELKTKRPEMYAVYLAWTKEEWFKEKVRGYNYDRHFAPGGKTETYYREWAAKKGLKPALESDHE
jgi:hypothetical protein